MPVVRVNMDGVEGSSIPGGLHLARYGGGDAYRQVDPLLSVWCKGTAATETAAWSIASAALPRCTIESRSLLPGFNADEVLPGGAAPTADALACAPHVHLVVSRMPPSDAAATDQAAACVAPHASLMLHGWLFDQYAASGRKAHQLFPLFSLSGGSNLAPPRQDEPAWLRIDGEFSYADQHVHKDEPIDLGGFIFCECFFGSDMARVAPLDPKVPCCCWATAVDVESARALVALVVLLPSEGGSAAVDAAITAAATAGEVAGAIKAAWGESGVEAALAGI